MDYPSFRHSMKLRHQAEVLKRNVYTMWYFFFIETHSFALKSWKFVWIEGVLNQNQFPSEKKKKQLWNFLYTHTFVYTNNMSNFYLCLIEAGDLRPVFAVLISVQICNNQYLARFDHELKLSSSFLNNFYK